MREWWQAAELYRPLAAALRPIPVTRPDADAAERCRRLRRALADLAALAGDELAVLLTDALPAPRRLRLTRHAALRAFVRADADGLPPAVEKRRALLAELTEGDGGQPPPRRNTRAVLAALAELAGELDAGDAEAPATGRDDTAWRHPAELLAAVVTSLLDHPERRLATYGTLAPGRSNHWVVAELAGSWRPGTVRGILRSVGLGVDLGYPILDLDPDAEPVPVHVFESDELPARWRAIDDFEGEAYRRTVVPVLLEGDELTVAHLYAAR